MAKEKLKKILIHENHELEQASKRLLESALHDKRMLLSSWMNRDYGIDAVVEVTPPHEKDLVSEGQFFMVQLKSQQTVKSLKKGIPLDVETRHLLQWFGSNNHVMLVLADISTSNLYAVWIDEVLVNSLSIKNINWTFQDTIRIFFPPGSHFLQLDREEVWHYIRKRKKDTGKLSPGLFFDFSNRSGDILTKCKQLTSKVPFKSIGDALTVLEKNIKSVIYKVAITGPSRAGKSTFINKFLNRENISPTDVYQTTGVPIQVYASNREYIKISFEDGTEQEFSLTDANIRAYATQQENENNFKHVRQAAIFIINEELEKGISFIDLPGLDDADEGIVDFAWSAAIQSNAVIYLIDASPFENGGYVLRKDFKEQVLQLGKSLDKVFLVFNKVDALTGDKLKDLQLRVNADLKKYGVYEHVDNRVYFISTRYKGQSAPSEYETSFKLLQNDIWQFLITESKTGLSRLGALIKELQLIIINYQQLLQARLLDDKKQKKVLVAIDELNAKVSSFQQHVLSRRAKLMKEIPVRLRSILHDKVEALEQKLRNIPVDQQLPDKSQIKAGLFMSCHETFEAMNEWMLQECSDIKLYMDNWIAENLREIRALISGSGGNKTIQLAELELMEVAEPDYSKSIKTGILTGLVTAIFYPPLGILAGIVALIGNISMTEEERRKKRIDDTIENARQRLNAQFKVIGEAYVESIEENFRRFIDYAKTNIEDYGSDLSSQLDNSKAELTPSEINSYEEVIYMLPELDKQAMELSHEIRSWLKVI